MSRNFPANQYEQAFISHRLGNWEVPAEDKAQKVSAETRYSTLRPRDGTTQIIADDRGHLLPGVPKQPGAFNYPLKEYEKNPARWPKQNPAIKQTESATMGFKGIQTDYLPTSTVSLKPVEIQGCKEFNYR